MTRREGTMGEMVRTGDMVRKGEMTRGHGEDRGMFGAHAVIKLCNAKYCDDVG